jgi:hypothetical protein
MTITQNQRAGYNVALCSTGIFVEPCLAGLGSGILTYESHNTN